MMINSLFEKASSEWIRFSKYEIKEKDGREYITPCADSEIYMYDPLQSAEQLVLDALNTGRMIYEKHIKEEQKREALLSFIHKYGLLGLMTNIPLVGGFIESDNVRGGSLAASPARSYMM